MKRPTRQKNTPKELAEAKRIAALDPDAQKAHPRAIKTDHSLLEHVNTYGPLPDYYIDQLFVCCDCGTEEIWRASDQKWYFEEAKGHIDARAVRCHVCRVSKTQGNINSTEDPISD
jgi:hypothetical protein